MDLEADERFLEQCRQILYGGIMIFFLSLSLSFSFRLSNKYLKYLASRVTKPPDPTIAMMIEVMFPTTLSTILVKSGTSVGVGVTVGVGTNAGVAVGGKVGIKVGVAGPITSIVNGMFLRDYDACLPLRG